MRVIIGLKLYTMQPKITSNDIKLLNDQLSQLKIVAQQNIILCISMVFDQVTNMSLEDKK